MFLAYKKKQRFFFFFFFFLWLQDSYPFLDSCIVDVRSILALKPYTNYHAASYVLAEAATRHEEYTYTVLIVTTEACIKVEK